MFGGSGMNLITTIIGFGMSATFIVFVCTRLICGRFRRMESREMFEIGTRMEFELPEHRINGLEADIVAAIPTLKFDRAAFSSTEDSQCTICLGEYEEKEVLRIMPKCGHSFHLSCIDVWLRKQSTCPVCRLSVQGSYETKFTRPSMLSGMPRSLDESEVSIEHSQIFLLPPTGGRSSEGGTTSTPPPSSVSVSISHDSNISEEVGARS